MCSATAHPAPQWRFTDVSFYWAGSNALQKTAQGTSPQGVGFQVHDLSLGHGDFVLLSGPSGAGKSSFLRLLVLFEQPTTGAILYEDAPLASFSPTVLRRQVALLPQSPIMGAATLREVLLLPYTFRAGAKALPLPDDSALLTLLAQLKLDTLPLDSVAEDLSLGQKQRVALARSLLLTPRVLLVDEPTSALDAESRHCVEQCLENANAQGVSIIMITHTDYCPQRPVRTLELRDRLLHEIHAPAGTSL